METPEDPRINALEQLAQKLKKSMQSRMGAVQTKYDYYNADAEIADLHISTPLKLVNTRPGIGWAGRAVNTLSDRIVFDGFANDRVGINDYMDAINAGGVLKSALNDGFVGGCAFVMIGDDPVSGRKILIPFTATEATGVIDQTSGLLKYGMAVTRFAFPAENADAATKLYKYEPKDYYITTSNLTAYFVDNQIEYIIPNVTGRNLLHPITHRASADRPLGKSRISNTVRRIVQEVGRQKRREEIAEEFYSLPQRYINGLAAEATKNSELDSAIGKVWALKKDSDGEKPDIGQLEQMSINQFETAKKDKARDFCAETGLTLRNLGYETANPTSEESLTAMSDDLLLIATNSQEEMGKQIRAIAITLRMAIDGVSEVSDLLNALTPAWKPIFKVDPAKAGDSLFKLLSVMPELAGTLEGYQMLGVGVRQAEMLQARRLAAQGTTFMNNGGTA